MQEKGFSLLELMIVIAIIGVLASFAIPTYQTYVMKARVSEGLHLAEVAKLAVADYVLTTHHLPNTQDETHYVSPSSTENVQEIAINTAGEITITYTQKMQEGTLILTPTLYRTGDLNWTCHLGTLDKRYVPSMCH